MRTLDRVTWPVHASGVAALSVLAGLLAAGLGVAPMPYVKGVAFAGLLFYVGRLVVGSGEYPTLLWAIDAGTDAAAVAGIFGLAVGSKLVVLGCTIVVVFASILYSWNRDPTTLRDPATDDGS